MRAKPSSRKTSRKPLRRTPQSAARLALPDSLPVLHTYYDALYAAHGPQGWWPGRTRLEIILGAILTQNTAWVNVEAALRNLRQAGLLSYSALVAAKERDLQKHLRPSGYFRQKARKVKSFLDFVESKYGGSLDRMFERSTVELRHELLALHGIGPETADCILLYAAERPSFVIDAYTRRLLHRHGHATGREPYEELRRLFEKSLPLDAMLYNEYHALIVLTGKEFCKAREALCANCALRPYLPEHAQLSR